MRIEILSFLKNEVAKKKPNEADTFNLAPFLARTFPKVSPKEVKALLKEMNADNVVNLSGDYGSLGASFGGVVKGVKDVVIHAQLTKKGREEVDAVAPRPVQSIEQRPFAGPVKTVPVSEIIPPAVVLPTESEKALEVLTNHITANGVDIAPE